jgi:acyl dehydratase
MSAQQSAGRAKAPENEPIARGDMTDPGQGDGKQRLTLDDLRVGQRFTSGTHAIDAAQIKAFAGQFDPQPFHLDAEAAKDTLFGELAASGWHTMAITMRLLVDGGLPLAGGIIGAGAEVGWPQPTRPGDILQVESEVIAITPSRSRPDRGMATVRSETRNQRGEVVQTLTSKLIVPRRGASISPPQGSRLGEPIGREA